MVVKEARNYLQRRRLMLGGSDPKVSVGACGLWTTLMERLLLQIFLLITVQSTEYGRAGDPFVYQCFFFGFCSTLKWATDEF